jgi:uncharacterized protein (TIGR02145 family)
MKIHLHIIKNQIRGIPAGFCFEGRMKIILLLFLMLILSKVAFAQCEEGEVELWNVCYNIQETTHLELHNISGEIPSEIGNLINLTYLNIEGNSNNQLIGEIPHEIGNLVNLTGLCLELNQLSGEIPSEIGNLVNLETLWLFNNQLSGVIPSEIGNLVNLYTLKIENNQFNGEIPQEICDLTLLIPNYDNWLFQIQNNNLCPPYPYCIDEYVGYQDCVEDVYGCIDPNAINYNPEANIDNESCLYLEDIDQYFIQVWQGIPLNPMGIYVTSAILDEINLRIGDEIGVFDDIECIGMIQLTDEITSPIQIFLSQDNPDTPEIDGFEEGANIIYKFWDASEQIEVINVIPTILNGDDIFTPVGFSEVELQVYSILGCTEINSINYNPNATVNDGTCIPTIIGCMDPEACNYDPEANEEGSCVYYDCTGECNGGAFFDDCDVCDNDPSNDNECYGCSDQWALNYDPNSTISDDSCEYPSIGDISMDGFINVNDIVLLVGVVLDGEYYIEYMDINQDSYLNIIDIVILVDIILNPSTFGCNDLDAGNYDPSAIYNDGSCNYNFVIDIDGNVYNTIVINEQEWMAENLKASHYRNGDTIPSGLSESDWGNLNLTETGAFAINDDNPSNADIYGNLYNWYAVNDERDICPEGWLVPSDEEWMEIEIALGMSNDEAHGWGYHGTNEGSKLAGNADLWNNGNLEADEEFESSGFMALPAGFRSVFGNYWTTGDYCRLWSSSSVESENYAAIGRAVNHDELAIFRAGFAKLSGYSVRCIKDSQ